MTDSPQCDRPGESREVRRAGETGPPLWHPGDACAKAGGSVADGPRRLLLIRNTAEQWHHSCPAPDTGTCYPFRVSLIRGKIRGSRGIGRHRTCRGGTWTFPRQCRGWRETVETALDNLLPAPEGAGGAARRGHALRHAGRRQAAAGLPGDGDRRAVRRVAAPAPRGSPPRSRCCTPIRWCMTICRRWTTTICAAASRPPTRRSTRRPRSWPATRCRPARSRCWPSRTPTPTRRRAANWWRRWPRRPARAAWPAGR